MSVLIRCYACFDEPAEFERAHRYLDLLGRGEFQRLVEELGADAMQLVESEEEDADAEEMSAGELIDELEDRYPDVILDADTLNNRIVLEVEGPDQLEPEAVFDFLTWLGASSLKAGADQEESDETFYYRDGEYFEDAAAVGWPDPDWLESEPEWGDDD